MGYVINCNGGMINNYIGDGLMALFGLGKSRQGDGTSSEGWGGDAGGTRETQSLF